MIYVGEYIYCSKKLPGKRKIPVTEKLSGKIKHNSNI
jgi:hypothetical protein